MSGTSAHSGWQTAFLAMSAALGASADDALGALGPARDPRAREMEAALRGASKTARAKALALGLGAIARGVDALDIGARAEDAAR